MQSVFRAPVCRHTLKTTLSRPRCCSHVKSTNKPQSLTPQSIVSNLWKASSAWDKYDFDKNGELSIRETIALLNGPEIKESVKLLTNVEPSVKTEAELQPLFDKADKDKSGSLSKQEFLALYTAVVLQRVQGDPLVLAEGFFAFIDQDRNGKVDGNELKLIFALLGFPAAMLLPIPGFVNLPYKAILDHLKKTSPPKS